MPSTFSSPPPKHRSPSNRRSLTSTMTPPLPAWDTPTSYLSRKSPQSTPRQRRQSLVPPPLPTSPAMHSFDSLPPPSPRSLSRSSSSSSAASSSRIATPPMKQRPRSASKLLPALPLSVNTSLTPPSKREKRIAVDYSAGDYSVDEVQIVINEEAYFSPRSPSISTPPRPARRSPSRRRESAVNSPRTNTHDLLPPQAAYTRSASPSDSIVTVSEAASTPRAATRDSSETFTPAGSTSTLVQVPASEPLIRKRDSAQRRLSALRGLVGNLDFNQPWSLSEQPEESDGSFFWACPEPLETVHEPVTQPSTPLIHEVSPHRPRSRRMTNAGPSHFSLDQPATSPPVMPTERVDVTPARQSSLARKPSSTPPRRPRQFRSSSDLLSRTPDPPRPSRQRKEVFDVASSGYSKCIEPPSPGLPATPTLSWRSSLTNDDLYERVLQTAGPSEIKRQEIIWEMCETEQAFVKSMRTVLRLFAIPLKTPQGKWIQGIPERITELFDLLECVAHAHGIVAAAQRDMRRRTEVPDTKAFLTAFKDWVPRLDVHEWYLLRFEAVVQLVEDNVRDKDSVFGEFVRMQMKEEVLGSMSLGSMLLKPVQRLTKYPLFLRRLLEVTPYPHPCHADILSVLSTTESIILNLQATKAREEDFEQLQALENKLQGLPEGFTLAVRGRKLLGQGSVVRVLPQKDLSPSISTKRANSLHSSRGSISSTVSSAYSSPWDFYGGLTPSTCRTSAFSVSSSSSSYCPPSRSSSMVQTSPQRPSISRSPSSASSFADSRPPTPGSLRTLKRKEETQTILIFNDLIVIASETSDRGGLFTGKRKAEKTMRVLQEIEGGIGKVAEVKDWSGWQGHSSLFTVTMTPLGQSCSSGSLCTTAFTLPAPGSPRHKGVSLSCPHLSSLQQFLTVLAQTTTIPGGYGIPEEGSEGKEILQSDQMVL